MVMRTIVAALTALMLFATPVVAGVPPPVVDGNILPKVAQTRCGCG